MNCLSAGTYTNCSGIELLRKDNGTEVITNCYRKTSGGSQGTDASGMSNSELVAALGSGWEENGEAVLPKDGKRPPVASPLFQGVTITSTTPAPTTSTSSTNSHFLITDSISCGNTVTPLVFILCFMRPVK